MKIVLNYLVGLAINMAYMGKKRFRLMSLGLVAILFITLGFYAVVHADLDSGYFTGNKYSGHPNGTFVLPQNYSGKIGNTKKTEPIAIPTSVNSKADFISFLKDYNGKSNKQEKFGSAFIVCTMLQMSFSECKSDKVGYINNSKTISKDGWDELTARLDNPAITVDWNVDLSTQTYLNFQNSLWDTKGEDDFTFTDSGPETNPPITFTYTNPKNNKQTVVYRLFRTCANPIGGFPGLPLPPPTNKWTVGVGISVSSPTAKPGDYVQWTHSVTNNGPDATDQTVHYYWQNGGNLGIGTGGSGSIASGFTPSTKSVPTSPRYLVTQNDVGQSLCRSTNAYPRAWNDGSTVSVSKCTSVSYNYKLTPSISLNKSGAIETGDSFIVTPSVANSGPTISNSTQWQLTQLVVTPGSSVPHLHDGTALSDSAPCGTYFSGSGVTCVPPVSSGTTVFSETGSWLSGSTVTPSTKTVDDYDSGTKLCYAFSLQPNSSSSAQWIHTAPVCLTVGVRPKTQIWGGDLLVGGSVMATPTTKNGNTFGSWAEYGIVASGGITGAASGAAFAGPTGLVTTGSSPNICDYSKLSFTNTTSGNSGCDSSTTVGRYSNSATIPDVAASFPTDLNTPKFTSGTSLSGLSSGVYTTNGDVSITSSTIGKGQWIVINAPTADVTINDDITYYQGGGLKSINDVPQVVIIAKDINITSKVKNIDAWLIAKDGAINTCSTNNDGSPLLVGANLSSTICNQKLVVNGPVMAGKLYLRRTGGSGAGPASGVPAEIFNLRADAYMWAQAQASAKTYVQTVYTTELPPRF